jgi:hypothetical protein
VAIAVAKVATANKNVLLTNDLESRATFDCSTNLASVRLPIVPLGVIFPGDMASGS